MARILIACFVIVSSAAWCSDLLWPLPDHKYLTGGHADSRINHFHGGVDTRTSGEHLPVIAPDDGRIERLAVTPAGYGKVVYFRLENDTTVVFGHLDRFCPRLNAIVEDSQFVAGTYSVSLVYEDELPELLFKKGEVLAYTGQTGRGAPHLHFEMRDEAVQIDPLLPFDRNDSAPPVITELRYVNQSEFNLQSTGRKIELQKKSGGRFTANAIQSNGSTAFLISCYDPGSWNRNAVPSEMRVFAGDSLIYQTNAAQIDLLGPKDIYAHLVWAELSRSDRDLRRLFDPTSKVDVQLSASGWISEADHLPVRIEVTDRSGNLATIELDLTITPVLFNASNTNTGEYSAEQFSLSGDAASLSWVTLGQVNDHEVSIGESLDGFYDQLMLTYQIPEGENKTGLYWYQRTGKGGRSARWSIPDESKSSMSCYVLRGGVFGIGSDMTPPKLLLTTGNGEFKFDLRDAETGIDDSTIRCTIDGRTAIAEYEYEENGGAIRTREPLRSGAHAVRFEAANRAGVGKSWDLTMTLP
jgi:hypothetical protein